MNDIRLYDLAREHQMRAQRDAQRHQFARTLLNWVSVPKTSEKHGK